jgi:beta-lactamase regulating signal transducer with metallopeptidase domain
MVASWMIRIAIASGLIAVGTLLIERAMQVTGGARRAAWVAGLLASAGLPLLVWLNPGFVAEALVVRLDFGAHSAGSALDAVRSLVSGVPGDRRSFTADGIVIGVWVAGALLLASLYGSGWWRLRKARREWRRDRVAGRAVLVSRGVGPAAVGLVNPTIVVPAWLLSEDERTQRLVVLHEAEHIAAGDHFLLSFAPLVLVLAPWNPALWFMVWRLRLAIEVDCDRRVLSRGVEAADYGTLLIDVAGRTPAFGFGAAFATRRTNLERRLLALTASSPRLASVRALLYGGAALMLAVMACAAAVPAAGRDLAAAFPELTGGLGGAGVTYLIDGRSATEDEAISLPRSRIDHVAVARRQRIESGRDVRSATLTQVVSIFTKDYAAVHGPGSGSEAALEDVDRSLDQFRERLRASRPSVYIDGQPATFEAFDALPASRVASLVVTRSADPARSEIRVVTRASAAERSADPLQPRDET